MKPDVDLDAWLQTPPGQYVLEWEREHVNAAVADIFGYHALQLGIPELAGLHDNRMPHRWLATEQSSQIGETAGQTPDFCTHFAALPFPAQSLDLVLLPHTLELSDDPHATLREVERTLVAEGRVAVCGFNPWSWWGLRQRRGHLLRRLGWGSLYLPAPGELIGVRRLRDWLNLLGFEVEVVRFGCYRPSVSQAGWLQRWAWMDRMGARWWPVFGSTYFLVAVKRVRGMRLLGPAWKPVPVPVRSPATVANRVEKTAESFNHETSQGQNFESNCQSGGHLHRWSLQGQPWPRRLGCVAALGRWLRERAVWWRAGHNQQPNGDDGGDTGATGTQTPLHSDPASG